MSDNKNLIPESPKDDMMAIKPEGFVLVLNEKGAEWLKQQKPRPNQREEILKKAAKIGVTSYDITRK